MIGKQTLSQQVASLKQELEGERTARRRAEQRVGRVENALRVVLATLPEGVRKEAHDALMGEPSATIKV